MTSVCFSSICSPHGPTLNPCDVSNTPSVVVFTPFALVSLSGVHDREFSYLLKAPRRSLQGRLEEDEHEEKEEEAHFQLLLQQLLSSGKGESSINHSSQKETEKESNDVPRSGLSPAPPAPPAYSTPPKLQPGLVRVRSGDVAQIVVQTSLVLGQRTNTTADDDDSVDGEDVDARRSFVADVRELSSGGRKSSGDSFLTDSEIAASRLTSLPAAPADSTTPSTPTSHLVGRKLRTVDPSWLQAGDGGCRNEEKDTARDNASATASASSSSRSHSPDNNEEHAWTESSRRRGRRRRCQRGGVGERGGCGGAIEVEAETATATAVPNLVTGLEEAELEVRFPPAARSAVAAGEAAAVEVWDQFEANFVLTGRRALEFDESVYTTPVPWSSLGQKRVQEAERIAGEIQAASAALAETCKPPLQGRPPHAAPPTAADGAVVLPPPLPLPPPSLPLSSSPLPPFLQQHERENGSPSHRNTRGSVRHHPFGNETSHSASPEPDGDDSPAQPNFLPCHRGLDGDIENPEGRNEEGFHSGVLRDSF
jgi:hypothetical protein